jgi:exonuclease SbcD
MLRLLHTADWHVGQTLAGFDRLAEHRAALSAIGEVIVREAIDVVIVAGDVFDQSNPSAEAQRVVYDALAAWSRSRPRLQVVLTAGNHDSPGRIEAPDGLLAAIGVRAVGLLHRREGAIDLSRHLIPLRDAGGEVAAHCLAVPFLRAADLPAVDADAPGSPVARAVAAVYGEAIAAARIAAGGLPLVATGHMTLAGGTESEGAERRILMGGEHAVPAGVFPADLAYVALGHLHAPQSVGRPEMRYAGSIAPLSRSEIAASQGVVVVEIGGEGVAVRRVPLPRTVAMHRLPAQGAMPPEAVGPALAVVAAPPGAPRETWPFVHLVITADAPRADLRAEIEAAAEAYAVRLFGVTVERGPAAAPAAAEPRRSLAEEDPETLFARLFEITHGHPPEERHRLVFARLGEAAFAEASK